MSTLTIADVERIAALAHLELTEEEKHLFTKQLADILEPGRRPKRALVLVEHGGAELRETAALLDPLGSSTAGLVTRHRRRGRLCGLPARCRHDTALRHPPVGSFTTDRPARTCR